MRKGQNVFDPKSTVRAYRKKAFAEIPVDKLLDFVGPINPKWSNDAAILGSWEKHFRGLKIPYAITVSKGYQHQDVCHLWKERRVEAP